MLHQGDGDSGSSYIHADTGARSASTLTALVAEMAATRRWSTCSSGHGCASSTGPVGECGEHAATRFTVPVGW